MAGLGNYFSRVMADEKWHFAKREGGKVLLVDGVECDVTPKGSKCNDADKTMFLALGCRPRMIEGEMCDGKIALIPCTEDYVTKRKSQFGPKGTLFQINIMYCRGDNNYKQAHNQGEKRQKDTGTAVDLSVNYEDYIACKDILARYNA